MAVLFSAVTVTAGDQEKEFLVRGIPRELHELIEKIVIHQRVTSPNGFKDQEVEIFYRFIGKIEF